MDDKLTPTKIVSILNDHVIGQNEAKKEVAISLRTRWRRSQLDRELQKEVTPANIILAGPTGVGKTEIARRIANLTKAPFLKTEATKFTEVGYVGGQVTDLVHDLVEIAARKVKDLLKDEYADKIAAEVNKQLLEAIAPTASKSDKEKLQKIIEDGKLDDEIIHYAEERLDLPPLIPGAPVQVQRMLDTMGMSASKVDRTIPVKVFKQILTDEIADDIIDPPQLNDKIIDITENNGIIFLDEVDKLVEKSKDRQLVSREGVQRDLLALVEGTTINTKYGMLKTDHILFIAAGAFTKCTPNDLMPEFQGRFPIRVELTALNEEDMFDILSKTKNSLVTQHTELMKTEGIVLSFTKDALKTIAKYATSLNKTQQNIGARRLHTIVQALLKEISFEAPDKIRAKRIKIDGKYVTKVLDKITKNEDLSKFIL